MSYAASAEDTFENVFEVIPTVGSNTEFFVKDFAVEDGTQWYATYDSAKSTLTMSGVQLGREDNGNLLGKFTEALTPDKSRGYGIFSFATEESEGSDPIVLTIDPASKQVSALTTDVEVPVADFTVNKIVGALAATIPTERPSRSRAERHPQHPQPKFRASARRSRSAASVFRPISGSRSTAVVSR